MTMTVTTKGVFRMKFIHIRNRAYDRYITSSTSVVP